MKSRFVTIGLVQTKVGTDIQTNIIKTAKLVEQAAKKGSRIIALQELYNVPYFPQRQKEQKDKYAETIPGNSTKVFSRIAKKYRTVIIVPIYEKDKAGKYHNSAIVIDDKGKIMDVYHKTHIPQDPGFYEKDYFEEGKTGYKIFKTKFARFAVLICYDQWFPEAARAVRLKGAEIIFYPTALGNIIGYNAEGDWHNAWETTMRGHGIANNVYIAAINRVGTENRMKFFGQSFISGPFGKVLARASSAKDDVLIAKLNLSKNEFYSEGWGFLRNRRPDTYGILTKKVLIKKSKKLKNVAHYKDEKKALGQA